MKCSWCHKAKRQTFYCGKQSWRCACNHDYRTPVEKRRDSVLNRYGNDPAGYTPEVLALLAAEGVLDVTTAFCPAGKLSLAEAKAREVAQVRRA